MIHLLCAFKLTQVVLLATHTDESLQSLAWPCMSVLTNEEAADAVPTPPQLPLSTALT